MKNKGIEIEETSESGDYSYQHNIEVIEATFTPDNDYPQWLTQTTVYDSDGEVREESEECSCKEEYKEKLRDFIDYYRTSWK